MDRWRGLVDAVSDADGAISFGELDVDGDALIGWLLELQVRAGRSAGLFQPTTADYEERRLVTGERLRTKLATVHIMSQEAARVLHILGGGNPTVAAAVRLASARLSGTCYGGLQRCTIGECAASFIGYVRFLKAVLGDSAIPDITWRLKTLAEHRDGRGRWRRFPPYYTMLVLSEMGLPAAQDELTYAKTLWSPGTRTAPVEEPYAERRSRLLATIQARLR
jgi:hypothetical protein